MLRILQYYGRYQSVRSRLGGLPIWARYVLVLAALPGIVLVGLSILALLVSLLALLLLTVPAYRLLMLLTGAGRAADQDIGLSDGLADVEMRIDDPPPSGRRHIDVKIVE